MQNAWTEVCNTGYIFDSPLPVLDMPMPVEVKIGYNWGEIEAGENVIYTHSQ
jgi:hypothetical protein